MVLLFCSIMYVSNRCFSFEWISTINMNVLQTFYTHMYPAENESHEGKRKVSLGGHSVPLDALIHFFCDSWGHVKGPPSEVADLMSER
jgi:hypothetical protein